MYPSQLCHSAIVEVAPIRYSSAIELLRMKLGFGYFKFPDDASRNIFTIAGSDGIIENIVFTTTPVFFTLATLPEIVAQGLMFGYLLVLWERLSHHA